MFQCHHCRASIEMEEDCFELCQECGKVLVNEGHASVSGFERFQDWSRKLRGLFQIAS